MNNEDTFIIDLKSIRVGEKKKDVERSISIKEVKKKKEEIDLKKEILKTKSKKKRKPGAVSDFGHQRFTYSIFALILILLVGIGLFLFLKNLNNYYLGNWHTELTESEKSSGIQKVLYTISDNSIIQETQGESNGVKTDIKVNYSVNLREKQSASAFFIIKDIKIDSLDVSIDSKICNNQESACNLIRDNYKKSFGTFLDKQKETLANTTLRISPSDKDLRLIFANGEEVKLVR